MDFVYIKASICYIDSALERDSAFILRVSGKTHRTQVSMAAERGDLYVWFDVYPLKWINLAVRNSLRHRLGRWWTTKNLLVYSSFSLVRNSLS